MVMYGIYNAEALENLIIQYITCIISLQKLNYYLQENLTQHILSTLMHQTHKNMQ